LKGGRQRIHHPPSAMTSRAPCIVEAPLPSTECGSFAPSIMDPRA
jgi:hypothetical protein